MKRVACVGILVAETRDAYANKESYEKSPILAKDAVMDAVIGKMKLFNSANKA